MAITAGERDQVWRAFMRTIVGENAAYTKPQLRAAVDAADDWCDTNAASYNTALPVAFRTTATPAQKSALLALVCWLRAGRPLNEGL